MEKEVVLEVIWNHFRFQILSDVSCDDDIMIFSGCITV